MGGITLLAVSYGIGIKLTATIYVALLSYFMAVQYDAFTKVNGLAYGSICMTGNIKSFSSNLTQYIITRKKSYLEATVIYFGLVGLFFTGAITSTFISRWLGNWTLLISTLILGAVYIIVRGEGS